VFAVAAPLLVPLVEEGWFEHRATPIILREYLDPLRARRIDTLILACTHFPLLKDAVRKVVGKNIRLVDCADTSASFAREQLAKLGLLCTNRRRPGRLQTFVTDEAERFTKLARRFLAEKIEPATQVMLPPWATPTIKVKTNGHSHRPGSRRPKSTCNMTQTGAPRLM
jgi:glutamate racemase